MQHFSDLAVYGKKELHRQEQGELCVYNQKLHILCNVNKLTENDKEAGVCLYVSERTPAITYTKMA